jgi:hypothetical protein
MLSRKALEELADCGGFAIVPAHREMYCDYSDHFAVIRPSWYDEEKKQLETTLVSYQKDEEGFARFLTDWELFGERQEFKISLVEKQ